jgi:type IV pilus assembly protein PilA
MLSGKNRAFRLKPRKRNKDVIRERVMRKKERGFSLIELMIVVAIMGILVAIAMPQYQNYQIRSKVTEALVMGASVKVAVASYYSSKGEWPVSNAEAGLPEAVDLSSTYIRKIVVGGTDCGHIKIKMRPSGAGAGLGKMTGRWLWLRPTMSTSGGSIEWSCAVESFNNTEHLVPKQCRNRPDNAFKSCP